VPYNKSGQGSEKRNLVPVPGSNPDSLVIQPVPYFINDNAEHYVK
jgi:hypothetical protein